MLRRIRAFWYKRGHRPRLGTFLYSPSLDLKYEMVEALEAFIEDFNKQILYGEGRDLNEGNDL